MNLDTFREQIQQNVIQNNQQGVIDRLREFMGGQEVVMQVENVGRQNMINNIDLDDTIAQLQNTFYKMDSLSKQRHDNKYINKQIKIKEESIITYLKSVNVSYKQATKTSKFVLKYDKKISKIIRGIDSLQTYKTKLEKSKSNLINILISITSSDPTISRLINLNLSNINQDLRLPEDLEQGYEPNFIDKLKISGVLTDTKKTFNKVKSAIDEIDMELQQVNSQIASMNQ